MASPIVNQRKYCGTDANLPPREPMTCGRSIACPPILFGEFQCRG
jgi:hypothetical protein